MGTTVCGWCLTGDHKNHKPSITYYDQKWECPCTDCAKEAKP